jgi:hypothetical protein
MVALSASTDKGSGGKNVHITECPLVAIAVSRDAVCGLLTECLEDVSFTILAMLYSFASFTLLLGFFISLCFCARL